MVNITRFFKNEDNGSTGQVLPLLPLRDIVIFPQMVAPLFVGRPKSVAALSDAMNAADKYIFSLHPAQRQCGQPRRKGHQPRWGHRYSASTVAAARWHRQSPCGGQTEGAGAPLYQSR